LHEEFGPLDGLKFCAGLVEASVSHNLTRTPILSAFLAKKYSTDQCEKYGEKEAQRRRRKVTLGK